MRIGSVVVSILLLAALPAPPNRLWAAVSPPTGPLIPPRIDVQQWSIEGLPPLSAGIGIGYLFALRNTEAGKYFRFLGKTPSWQDVQTRSFTWATVGGGTTLRYAAGPVAIKIQGRYLRATDCGSPLPVTLSDTPVFEWRITGGSAGQLVPVSQPVGLRNVVKNDELVVCPQARVLGWQIECAPYIER